MMRSILAWLNGKNEASGKRTRTPSKPRGGHTPLRLEPLECRELLAADVTPVYRVDNSWNSGFQAAIRLENNEAVQLDDWRLEFDMPADITSIWNAEIVSRAGDRYVIVGAPWAPDLPGDGSISFGFVAAADNQPVTPSNYVVSDGSAGELPPPLPSLSIGAATIDEGDDGLASAVFTVRLSSTAAGPVTVDYQTVADSATAGVDFQAASGKLTFAPGETAKALSVAIVGDVAVEPDETFYVDLFGASGATLAEARAAGTIVNDDVAPAPNADFQFRVTADWGSAFTGEVMMFNSGATAINNWQVEFDFAGNITSIWDAEIVSQVGDRFVVKGASYNSDFAAGSSLGFGFVGSPGKVVVGPINFVLSGGAGTGNNPPDNRDPVAVDDFAFTGPGQALVIDVLGNDTDPDGDPLSVMAVGQPTQGTVELNSDSTIRYTPASGFTGSDVFSYTVFDANGASATANVTVTVAVPAAWPEQVFAPYVDMALYPIYDLVAAAQNQGLRYFTLAFIVADSQNQPAWGGFTEYTLGSEYDTNLRAQISGVRALGGDVTVSFGGASNRELAEVITDVVALQAAYQSVIDAYGLTHIDFDIEGAAVADRESIDRRNQAIAGLQRDAADAGRSLVVSYTLPVLPTGLTPDGVYVIDSALRLGVDVGLVNIMAMDYGDSAAPNPDGRMGDYAIAAATSLFDQLSSLYGTQKTEDQLWSLIGVTPMIGLNDVLSETFDQQEARELLAFAEEKGIGRISMWSLNRDQQHPNGELGRVDLKSSSILQAPFEFSQIFDTFTG